MWEKISEQLNVQCLSQSELARRMNVHADTLSAIKRGRNKQPSFLLVCKMADALGVTTDQLRPDDY